MGRSRMFTCESIAVGGPVRVLGRPLRRLTEPRSPLRCGAAVNERMLEDGGLLEADVVGRKSILLELERSPVAQCGPLDGQLVKHRSSHKFCVPQ